MKCLIACWFAAVVFLMSGCGVVDWLIGAEVKEETLPNGDVVTTVVDKPGDSPLESAGKIGGIFFPGSDLLLGGLATVLAMLRGRQYKKAAVSTAETLEAFLRTPAGALVADEVKKLLSKGHSEAGVYDIMKSIVGKFGHSV